jgi:RNA polymerase sigma factor (sigma-70 family)
MTGDTGEKGSEAISRRAQLARWVDANHMDFRRILRSKVAPLCRGIHDPDQVADELLSEAVAALLQSAEHFDTTRPEKYWAIGVANRVALRWQDRTLKEQIRRRTVFVARERDQSAPTDLMERLSLAARDDVEGEVIGASWVAAALAECSERDRKVVQLVVIDDLGAEEAGVILGLKPGTVRVQLSRALDRLRARLPEEERALSGRSYHAEGGKTAR